MAFWKCHNLSSRDICYSHPISDSSKQVIRWFSSKHPKMLSLTANTWMDNNGAKETNESAGRPLLTIFTTFKDTPQKKYIHRNMILNWASLMPRVQPVLFTNLSASNMINKLAVSRGWKLLPLQGINKHGTPFLRNMYYATSNVIKSRFYGFCNGDILFNKDLISTLEGVSDYLTVFNSTLVIGRRLNININESSGEILFDSISVTRKAKKHGKLFLTVAEDFFFIARPELFPWHTIKDVVIGRRGYDNYLVGQALRGGVAVVDATNTIVALHQTGKDGNFAGHRRSADKDYNIQLIGRYNYNAGGTDFAHYVTSFDLMGKVYIQRNQFKQKPH